MIKFRGLIQLLPNSTQVQQTNIIKGCLQEWWWNLQ